jgi:uncharacterized membrane protein YbhN (UPF0104 family)
VIFLISQFGKYIPGNVAHFFARASMAKNVNVPVQLSLNIMIMEIIWMIAVALFLGLFSFKGLHISTFGFLLNEPQIKWVPILSLLIFLSPWATVFLLNHFFSRTLYQSIKIKKLQFPPFFLACTSIIFFTIYFFILGLVLKIESNVFFSTFEISYFSSVSIFSLAWLAGFLMPGAPAGLGMREAVLVSFLTLWMNPLSAASLALLMRLTTTLGDGFAYLLGLFLRFKIKNL